MCSGITLALLKYELSGDKLFIKPNEKSIKGYEIYFLKKAINSLLGLEIVDQLNIDVDEFQRRSLIQLKTEEEQEKIEKLR